MFLLHFVANKEQFFIKFEGDEKKYEFSLNLKTESGQDFRNKLKAMNGNSDYINFRDISNKSIRGKFPVIITQYDDPPYSPGQIIAQNINIYIMRTISSFPSSQLIGNVIEFSEFNTTLASKIQNSTVTLQFLLEEEEEKKSEDSKSKKKSRHWKQSDWKTVKIAKRVKALKRYRIKKRLENLKILNRLKN